MSTENEANTIDAALIKERIDSTIKGLNVMYYDSSCESEHEQTRDSLESTLEILRITSDLIDELTKNSAGAISWLFTECNNLSERVHELEEMLNVSGK